MSTTKKIFLASSSELKEDRQEFEISINRKNKDLIKKGFFIELVIWEDSLDAMSQTRLQDEYNKAVRECDIFVMLFFTKVGQYTEEEFETAFGQFKTADKPLIYTYIKNAPIDSDSLDEQDTLSLFAFKKKLKNLGHFYTRYKNIDGLKYLFNRQLDKLLEEDWQAQKTFNLPGSPDHFIGRETPQNKYINDIYVVDGVENRQKTSNSIFISYSHKDKKYLDRLMVHLRPLEKGDLIDLWVDTKLKSGDKWKIEIENALKRARAAILLISADFLASDFIVKNELSPLLKKAELEGTRIIPVIVKPCRFTRDKNLSLFQAINDPLKPLIKLYSAEREKIYDWISKEIEELMGEE